MERVEAVERLEQLDDLLRRLGRKKVRRSLTREVFEQAGEVQPDLAEVPASPRIEYPVVRQVRDTLARRSSSTGAHFPST